MVQRPFWIHRIEEAWKGRSIVWLSGVRRVGKTTVANMFSGAVYLNCDLPSVERQLIDPEPFYDSLPQGSVVVFDEVQRLADPSRLLKIAADAYPHLRILATGSSTLAATGKFRDTLMGRKHAVYLSPVLWTECVEDFGIKEFDRRLFHGGLPEALLSPAKAPVFFAEWMDSFYARDVQELFGIRNRTGFMGLLRLLLRQSGGLTDYTNLAHLSDLSRHTVKAHIEAMAIAHALFLLPPFHGGGRREITQRPKCYAFDTGFVTFAKGWDAIREEDRGLLWEHLVLDVLRAVVDESSLHYWRDKSGREVDFVVRAPGQAVDAIECKISPDSVKVDNLAAFRALYGEGRNFVVTPHIKSPSERRYGGLKVSFVSAAQLMERLVQ
jgi:predicted AAA+ superfamily ATPase